MLRFPEQYERVHFPSGRLYRIPFNGVKLTVIATLDTDDKGITWEHVSVSLKHRIPTWQELKFIKMLFWDPEDEVIQFFPPVGVHQRSQKLPAPLAADQRRSTLEEKVMRKTEAVWHKFPEETPPEGVQILVTWKGENNSFEVTLGFWKFDKFTGGTFSHPYDWVATPIAWAELPEPYKPD